MKLLAAFFGKRDTAPDAAARKSAPVRITCDSGAVFELTQHLYTHEGLPILDWKAVLDWAEQTPDGSSVSARVAECKRGWLLHLRDALGDGYELYESRHGAVMAPYTERHAKVMLDYIELTRRRVAATIEGLGEFHDDEQEILIVFHDDEAYYRYVSHVYPADGEFAFSSGMFLHAGCPHFVTVHADDMHTVERIIAHEMTHASLAHLRIPLWVNEGLAVNVENRLAGKLPKLFTPAEMREKHLAFWNAHTVQEFWSGHSFGRPDDGSMLSYDLAQILIEILAGHWQAFRAFALQASYEDAGAFSAREHLGLDLGESIASIFEQSSAEGWRPDPARWEREAAHTPE